MNYKKYLPKSGHSLYVILKIYLIIILIFSGLRAFFYFYNQNPKYYFSSVFKLLKSWFWGLRFDLIPVTYTLAISFLLLLIYEFTQKKLYKKIAFWITYFFLSFLIFLYAADIIYYNEFAVHLNNQILLWFNDPATIFKMIIEAPELSFMFVPFFLIMLLWYYLLKKIYYAKNAVKSEGGIKLHLSYLFLIIIMIFASKGRIIGHTLKINDAYNDDNLFYNEFKLNPYFTIKESMENEKYQILKLMDDADAIDRVQKFFKIIKPKYTSPVARDINNSQIQDSTAFDNVVFIFMERKATWKMKYFGNKDTMTPFLDSLFLQSLSFDRFYSSGTRTFEGIYGSLYAYPILFGEHPLKNSLRQYYGIPQILKEKGFKTVFFCPHTPYFDNLSQFLPKNGFEKIYFENDYPEDSLRTNWGVDDHFLFNFAIKKMDSLNRNKQKFFSVILTISDHNPYWVPDYIKGKNIKIRAARFADWSLRDFFKKVKNKPWFDRTLFVMVGDHGKPKNGIYPTTLSTHHVPLLFYYNGVKAKVLHQIGDQKDILPMLMNLLQIDYTDNTFGRNILKDTTQQFAYFNHYEKNGMLNKNFLLVINNKGKTKGLYRYVDNNPENLLDSFPEEAEKMKKLLIAHLQTAFYIRKNNLQKKPKIK
jgi:phosphoglycerol transferase MdoB-like AlkP superfamily enzyme